MTNTGESIIIYAGESSTPSGDKPLDYFSSREYRDKFKELGENPFVTKSMYECARDAINANYNTDGEDAYLINSFWGTHSNPAHGEYLSADCEVPDKAKNGDYILVHNHPNNTPLSIGDVIAASDQAALKKMISVSHDGKIYYLEIGNGMRLSKYGITQKAQNNNTKEWRDFEIRVWNKYCKSCNGNQYEALKLMNETEGFGWKVGVIE